MQMNLSGPQSRKWPPEILHGSRWFHAQPREKLIGLISRSDILRAYDVAIVRKQRGQLLEEHTALRREQNNKFSEFHLRSGQNAVGKHLQDLNLPLSVKVVSLDREGSVHIPRGNTLFASGDIISIFGEKNAIEDARTEFQQEP